MNRLDTIVVGDRIRWRDKRGQVTRVVTSGIHVTWFHDRSTTFISFSASMEDVGDIYVTLFPNTERRRIPTELELDSELKRRVNGGLE